MTRRFSRKSAPLAGLGVLAVLTGLLVVGLGRGYPAASVPMTAAGAWLASSAQGLVTLVDGASGEAVGSVRVAPPGAPLVTTQAGSSVYVSDLQRGGVVRVDGATYERSDSVQFAASGPSNSLRVLATDGAVVVVDGERGLAARADPASLRLLEPPFALSAQAGDGQTLLDADGRMWLVDRDTGALGRVDPPAGEGRVSTVHHVGYLAPDARLLSVGGAPVALRGSQLVTIGGEGDLADQRCELDLRPGERPALAGAPADQRLYASLGVRGVVLVADTEEREGCVRAVQVGAPGHELGPAVEQGGMLFVPDLTTGAATVVDLGTGEVRATVDLVSPAARLELVATNGAVFYNDPGSERAGVIRLTGGAWQATPIPKYDPSRPGADLLQAAGRTPGPAATGVPPVTAPLPPGAPTPLPQQLPTGAGPARSTPPGGDTSTPPSAGPRAELVVRVEGEGGVTLRDVPPDAPEGTPETCGDSPDFTPQTCRWSYPGPTRVTLTATGPNVPLWEGCPATRGPTCTVSVAVPSTAVTVRLFRSTATMAGDVTVAATGDGRVEFSRAGGPFDDCTSCTRSVPKGTSIRLRAAPGAGQFLSSWGFPDSGTCADRTQACSFRVAGNVLIRPAFTADTSPPLLTLAAGTGAEREEVSPTSGNRTVNTSTRPVRLVLTTSDPQTSVGASVINLGWTYECADPSSNGSSPGGEFKTFSGEGTFTASWDPRDFDDSCTPDNPLAGATATIFATADGAGTSRTDVLTVNYLDTTVID